MITNTDAEPILPENRGQVPATTPAAEVEPVEADRFKGLMEEKTKGAESEAEPESNESAISLEELQRQMRENIFKSGFNRTMEKAREIAKEMKQ